MPVTPRKNLTLRAFKIENPNLTEPDSGILRLLKSVLSPESTAAQRRMPLNADDPDRDLLANFSWGANNKYMFGMMLRIIPADNGGVLNEEMFERTSITMADVSAGLPDQSQYKSHFYFALNNSYLVATLPGNINIRCLQTYLNWLLESVRGDRLFVMTELTTLPSGVPFNQIKQIQLIGGGATVAATPTTSEQTTISASLGALKDKVLAQLLGEDSANYERIRDNELVEAKLLLKLKQKPRGMDQEAFQSVMGAIATNVTDDSGIVVRTKNGGTYSGSEIKVKKSISVECTSANRIVEEQLKQEMECFLGELENRHNE